MHYAADKLSDTTSSLSGAVIVNETGAYAVEYDVTLQHPTYPFQVGNKRTTLYENLRAVCGLQLANLLEASQLPDTRADFQRAWVQFEKDRLTKTNDNPAEMALTYIENILQRVERRQAVLGKVAAQVRHLFLEPSMFVQKATEF